MFTKIAIALASIGSGTYLVAIDKLSGELYVGAILGPIIAGSVAGVIAARETAKNTPSA